QRKIVHIKMAARHLRRYIGARQRLADDRVRRRIVERRFRINLLRETLVAHQFADANAGASAFGSHAAADALELVCSLAGALGCEAQQRLARRRGGLADLYTAAHDAAASGG